MQKFLSGVGMGMIAGACLGLAASSLATDAEKRRARRKVTQAAKGLSTAASDLKNMMWP
ncbi:MAG: hypothetical protein IJT76_05580 [Clostridia bacterium]|nr:hypothetical protein [Clostridia bacterium]